MGMHHLMSGTKNNSYLGQVILINMYPLSRTKHAHKEEAQQWLGVYDNEGTEAPTNGSLYKRNSRDVHL